MKLKTLKDLENREWRHGDNPFGWVDFDKLKQEAIKWVKEIYPLIKTARIKNIDENNVIEWTYSGKRTDMDLFRMGQVSILIKVNNITKEHLK